MTRDEAAESFVKVLIKAVSSTSNKSFIEALSTGIPKNIFGDLSKWYQSLDDNGRTHVESITNEAVHFTLFNLLCFFDGVSGYDRVEGKPVNYTIVMETYRNIEDLENEENETAVRINSPSQEEPLLHNLFQNLTDRP